MKIKSLKRNAELRADRKARKKLLAIIDQRIQDQLGLAEAYPSVTDRQQGRDEGIIACLEAIRKQLTGEVA